jgi:hypothetical protein
LNQEAYGVDISLHFVNDFLAFPILIPFPAIWTINHCSPIFEQPHHRIPQHNRTQRFLRLSIYLNNPAVSAHIGPVHIIWLFFTFADEVAVIPDGV